MYVSRPTLGRFLRISHGEVIASFTAILCLLVCSLLQLQSLSVNTCCQQLAVLIVTLLPAPLCGVVTPPPSPHQSRHHLWPRQQRGWWWRWVGLGLVECGTIGRPAAPRPLCYGTQVPMDGRHGRGSPGWEGELGGGPANSVPCGDRMNIQAPPAPACDAGAVIASACSESGLPVRRSL